MARYGCGRVLSIISKNKGFNKAGRPRVSCVCGIAKLQGGGVIERLRPEENTRSMPLNGTRGRWRTEPMHENARESLPERGWSI